MGILFLGKNKKMAVRGREGSRVRERQDSSVCAHAIIYLNYIFEGGYIFIYNCAPK